jgi:2-keto-4-pentenoate hydratase/2-oxohepta-3-ene-1,7-dioic acid hydratase in catechol pathway
MKICRFNKDRLGLVEGDTVYDVSAAIEVLPSARWPLPPGDPLIRSLSAVREKIKSLRAGAKAHKRDAIHIEAPVPNPNKIVAAPANYALHVKEGKEDPGIHHGVHDLNTEGFATPSDKYGLFLKANSALVGPDDPIRLHFNERRNDHEIEIVAVIGTECKNVPASHAWDVIAAYTLGIDVTVRGGEDRSFRKSADTYAVVGPWLTTADEIANPEDLAFSLAVNGAIRQTSNTKFLTAKIPRLIEIATSCYTLYPGDLLFTGTPEGVGPLQSGDVIRAECAALGEINVGVA